MSVLKQQRCQWPEQRGFSREFKESQGFDSEAPGAPRALPQCTTAENRHKMARAGRPLRPSQRLARRLSCIHPNQDAANMNLTVDHLADLLIGIARAQNAVIDAVDRVNPGFRSQHATPLITLAANMRAGDPRMIDLSARILMRLQGRVALDAAQVKADLERLMSGKAAPAAAPFAAPAAASAAASKPEAASPLEGLDFSAKG